MVLLINYLQVETCTNNILNFSLLASKNESFLELYSK